MDVLTPGVRRPRTPGDTLATTRTTIADLWRLLRPQQWVKSVFVVPIGLLGVTVWSPAAVWHLAWALALFVVGSSAVYVANDVIDRRADRVHPVKRSRPIASGRVGVPAALVLTSVLLVIVGALVALRPLDSWPLLTYLVLNAGYSLGLKRVAVLDIAIVATGFALRYVQGAIALGGETSVLLAVAIFGACLMFAAGKRRHEIGLTDTRHRSALTGYSVPFLDQLIGLAAVTSTLAWALYAREVFTGGVSGVLVILSTVLVAGLVVRYLQLVLVMRQGGDPSKDIASDRVTIVVGAIAAALVVTSTLWP